VTPHLSAETAALATSVPAALLIARIGRLVRQRVEQALAPSGLRQRQLVALSYLREHGPTPQQQLAERLCMDASSLVCLLNQLEDGGLIIRRRDRSDRRRGIVELSQGGQRIQLKIDAALRKIDEELLGELRPHDRALFSSLLAQLSTSEPAWAVVDDD
jgi:DNA-binding MarR family transcriptional regulator